MLCREDAIDMAAIKQSPYYLQAVETSKKRLSVSTKVNHMWSQKQHRMLLKGQHFFAYICSLFSLCAGFL